MPAKTFDATTATFASLLERAGSLLFDDSDVDLLAARLLVALAPHFPPCAGMTEIIEALEEVLPFAQLEAPHAQLAPREFAAHAS